MVTVVSTILKYSVGAVGGVVGQQPFKQKARFSEINKWKFVDKLNKLSEITNTVPADEFHKANAIILRKLTVPFLKKFTGLIIEKKLDDSMIVLKAEEFATHLKRKIFTDDNEKEIRYTDEDWFDPNWKFRRKIIINKDFISKELTEFPMQIHNKHGPEDPHSIVHAESDGRDFVVTLPDGRTQIPHELEMWDSVGNEFVIRFKPPVVKTGTTNLVYLYYGNPSATDSQQVSNVWSNNFIAVYHFQEDPSTNNYKDSVSNGTINSGVPTNVTIQTPGHHGNGAKFNGVDSKVDFGNDSSLDNMWTGGGAISCWMQPNSDGEGDFGRILDKTTWRLMVSDEVNGFVRLRFEHDFSTTNGIWQTDRIIPFTEDTWIAIEYNKDATTNDPVFYINGEKVTTFIVQAPAGTANSDAGNNLICGNNGGQTATFDGWIDEVQLHSVVRDDNWWRSKYRNETMDDNVKPFFVLFKNQEHYKKAANLIAQDILDSANKDMPSGVVWTLGEDFPTDVISADLVFMNHYEALNEISLILGKDLFFDNENFKVFVGKKGKTLDPSQELDIIIQSSPEQTVKQFANEINIIGAEDDVGKTPIEFVSTPPTLRFNFEQVVSDSKIKNDDHLTAIASDLLKEFQNITPQIKAQVPVEQFMRLALQSGDIVSVTEPKKEITGTFRIMEITVTEKKVDLILESTATATRRLRSQNIGEIIDKLIKDKNRG